MDTIIKFSHKYGYAALEEVVRYVILLKVCHNWWGVILFSALFFGIIHYRFGLLAVVGCIIGGGLLGWIIVFSPVPDVWSLLIVVVLHIFVAWLGKKYFEENKVIYDKR